MEKIFSYMYVTSYSKILLTVPLLGWCQIEQTSSLPQETRNMVIIWIQLRAWENIQQQKYLNEKQMLTEEFFYIYIS
jgi:hypothetical protein